jgi:hypothetical protein
MVVVLLFVDLKIQLFIEKLLFFQLKINAFPIFFQGWETLVIHIFAPKLMKNKTNYAF